MGPCMYKNCSLIVFSIVCVFIFCRCLQYLKKRRILYPKNLSISQFNFSKPKNQTRSMQPKKSSCDSILENGEWANFKKYGSWQRYNMDADNRIIVDEKPLTKYRLD